MKAAQLPCGDTQKQIVRFCMVTPFVGLTDFCVYFLAMKFVPVSAAKGIAFITAGVVGYLLNYLAVQIFLLGTNVSMNHLLLVAFPGALFPAMVIASLFSAAVIFLCKKYWVFR